MFDAKQFQRNPRAYALDLVEQGLVSAEDLLSAALSYMSYDDVRDMLDANELSPRFDEEDDEDFISEEDAQAMMDDFNYVGNRSHY